MRPDTLRLENVAFRYRRGASWVLRDVTIDLPPGRITEVTGDNGAGKSTLLALVAGILRPCQGRIRGRPERVGHAPERFPSAQPFTVAGYLRHQAAMRRGQGRESTALKRDIGYWSDRLGLAALMETSLPELSKGSAQKVGLVQALLGEPRLLVLDEPFAGLDARTLEELATVVADLRDQGAIILVSDHQRCLGRLSGVTRLHVAGGRAEPARSARSQPRGNRLPAPAHEPDEAETRDVQTLEVVVASAEADALAARLRSEGHQVRRQNR